MPHCQQQINFIKVLTATKRNRICNNDYVCVCVEKNFNNRRFLTKMICLGNDYDKVDFLSRLLIELMVSIICENEKKMVIITMI